MVFYGEYLVNFTEGGRLVFPKRLREVIKGNVLVLTKGFDGCLAGYGKEDWEERAKEFLTSSLLNTENLSLKRMVFSGAVYVELDEQGRFVLPKNLLLFSKIKQKAVVVGSGDHFEIWSLPVWEHYLAKVEGKTQVN